MTSKTYHFKNLFKDFDLERLSKEVNILLISDLHYDADKYDQKTKKNLADEINLKLVESLRTLVSNEEDWKPDIIIVAGDLVNQGKVEGYKFYFRLIENLIIGFPALKNAVFSTPGNHDINRNNIVSVYQYLYTSKKKDPLLKINNSYTSSEIVNTLYTISQFHLDDPEKTELKTFLLEFESEYFKTYLEQQVELEKNVTNNIPKHYPFTGLKTTYIKDILGIKLASINSSFFCNFSGRDDRNNLFYITHVIDCVVDFLKDSPQPVIAFMHHPHYHMHESEFIYPMNQENNNFNKLADASDLILSGHVHGELHEPTLINQKAYTVTNGTTFTNDRIEDKCYPYTYALLKVNKQLNKFKIKKYKYNSDSSAFSLVQNNNIYYSFPDRNIDRNISSELEKINVVNYLLNDIPRLPGISKIDYEREIILTQLDLYLPGKLTRRTVINSTKIKKLNCYVFKYKTENVLIIKISSKKSLESIYAFLSDLNKKKEKRPLVFFAIDSAKTISKEKKELFRELDEFVGNLKNAVLKSKYDSCHLNLIYY